MSPKVSILMSIYNETEEQIRESVESILSQTLADFEFIIVNDNPNRKEIKTLLDSYNDSRIRFIQNEKNIGLAMCMNKAASNSSADILARMDADDIAIPNRLEKEYPYVSADGYDFVFSRYILIDEFSKETNGFIKEYLPEDTLSKNPLVIPGRIHHPTVIFTRSIFEKVGGYRDFPCSQDLDLWNRMLAAGCRFIMLNDQLLKYRINPNSVSNKKWHQQQLTCDYINELFLERLKNGKDSYSKEDYQRFLVDNGCFNEIAENKLKDAYALLVTSKKYRLSGNLLLSIFYKMLAIMRSKVLLKRTICRIRLKMVRVL